MTTYTPRSIFWDIQTLSTITKDGSNRVSSWVDKLGGVKSVVQAGADNTKPIWSSESISFDGVAQFLQSAAWTWNHL